MEMPNGYKTLDYLADHALSVIQVNGHRLDGKFLKEMRDTIKEMHSDLEKIASTPICYLSHSDEVKLICIARDAVKKFEQWGKK